jgi:hypothetical protein
VNVCIYNVQIRAVHVLSAFSLCVYVEGTMCTLYIHRARRQALCIRCLYLSSVCMECVNMQHAGYMGVWITFVILLVKRTSVRYYTLIVLGDVHIEYGIWYTAVAACLS